MIRRVPAHGGLVLVATLLPPTGIGGVNRMLDALVGGVMGIIAMALLPASPFALVAKQASGMFEALGDALDGSDKPFLVTSGVALLAPGRLATEADVPRSDPSYPRRSEEAARTLIERGVRAAIVRLSPSVHGVGETHGFVPIPRRSIRSSTRTAADAAAGVARQCRTASAVPTPAAAESAATSA